MFKFCKKFINLGSTLERSKDVAGTETTGPSSLETVDVLVENRLEELGLTQSSTLTFLMSTFTQSSDRSDSTTFKKDEGDDAIAPTFVEQNDVVVVVGCVAAVVGNDIVVVVCDVVVCDVVVDVVVGEAVVATPFDK